MDREEVVEEGDDAGPALESVEPVGHPGMAKGIGFTTPPDFDSVESVKGDGNPDDGDFHGQAPGNVFETCGGFVEISGAYESVAVGPKMFDEKCADGNDAR